jgi:hypothetical protein
MGLYQVERLSDGPDYSFASGDTQREAWFIGTTFHISVDQFHDMLLSGSRRASICISDPTPTQNVRRVAARSASPGAFPQCLAGIRTLRQLDGGSARPAPESCEWLISEPLQSRMYCSIRDRARIHTTFRRSTASTRKRCRFLAANKGAPYPPPTSRA